MRIISIIFLLLSQTSSSQTYLEFKKLGLHIQKEQMDYVNHEISLQKEWSSRKIELVCLKSSLLNRIGEYSKAFTLIKSIPLTSVKKMNSEGSYQLALAVTNKYEGNAEAAYVAFKKAQDYFGAKEKFPQLADAFVEEAEFHRKSGQFEIGEAFIDSAKRICDKYKCDPWIKVKMLNRYAAIANEYNGTLRNGLDLSKECIELAQKEKAYYWLAISYGEIGSIYNNKSEHDLAIQNSELAENEFRKLGLLQDAMHAKLGRAHHSQSELKRIIYLEEIIAEVKQKNIQYSLVIPYSWLYSMYKGNGDYEKALFYLEAFNEVRNTTLELNQAKELAKISDDFKSVKLKIENDKITIESKRQEEYIKRQGIIFYGIVIFSIFLSIFAFVLWYNSREKRRMNTELELKNQEKDVLMKEIHHRVKNNLQYVQSILFFQLKEENGNNEALTDISRRISAVSLVHEMLYSENETDEISVRDYLEKLVEYNESLYVNKTGFNVRLKTDEIYLPIKKMEPIGMICSELLSNFIKYAKTETNDLKFAIELSEVSKGSYLLHIFDNGIKIDAGNKKDGLGIKLIDVFSRQLKGDYLLDRNNGYDYRMSFSINET